MKRSATFTHHFPQLLDEIANRIEGQSNFVSETASKAAGLHGAARYNQGYTVPMLLVEASSLQCVIAGILQEHLLAIDISNLISDMQKMTNALNRAVEQSVRAFLSFEPRGASTTVFSTESGR